MSVDERLGSIRRFLQDMIAPEVRAIQVGVEALAANTVQLGEDVKGNTTEILNLWQSVSKMEGRVEGLKDEVVAKVQVEFMRLAGRGDPAPRATLGPGDENPDE